MDVTVSISLTELFKKRLAAVLFAANVTWLAYLGLTVVAFMMVGCGHAGEELQKQLGCTIAGNGCNSQGADGAAGAIGQPGSPGNDGRDGVDATPVTIVQLCPGTTTYPSVFVEIAFCVSGRLYGTYSTHGGFSTELPPGNYSSNTLGSRCNLTIHTNCVVSN